NKIDLVRHPELKTDFLTKPDKTDNKFAEDNFLEMQNFNTLETMLAQTAKMPNPVVDMHVVPYNENKINLKVRVRWGDNPNIKRESDLVEISTDIVRGKPLTAKKGLKITLTEVEEDDSSSSVPECTVPGDCESGETCV